MPAVIATGVGKVTVCHPVEDSPVKVADASFVPPADHKVPTWLPVFAEPL